MTDKKRDPKHIIPATDDQLTITDASFQKKLSVKLDEPELRDLARAAAEKVDAKRTAELAKKEASKAAKGKIDNLNKDIERLSTEVRTGKGDRLIECRRERDDRIGVMREIRLDTGAEVSKRTLSIQERQQNLFDSTDEKTMATTGDEAANKDGAKGGGKDPTVKTNSAEVAGKKRDRRAASGKGDKS